MRFVNYLLLVIIGVALGVVGERWLPENRRKVEPWRSPWQPDTTKSIPWKCFTMDATERVFVFTDSAGTAYYTNRATFGCCPEAIADSIREARKIYNNSVKEKK